MDKLNNFVAHLLVFIQIYGKCASNEQKSITILNF